MFWPALAFGCAALVLGASAHNSTDDALAGRASAQDENGMDAAACSLVTADCDCSLCTRFSTYLEKYCCVYKDVPMALLAFEHDDLWSPRVLEFNGCTGARMSLSFTPGGEDAMQGELENDVGVSYETSKGLIVAEGAGIFDGYVVQGPWIPSVVDGLENLSPRIANDDAIDWLDINPISREIVSYNSTVRALPLDVDYIAVGYREDVFLAHGKQPPQTIDELVELSEYFNGLDHNDDGIPDWGFCLSPQPNYFYAFVAPMMMRSRQACAGRVGGDPDGPPLCDGTPSGENLFFNADSFRPLFDTPAVAHAARLFLRLMRSSNCPDQIAGHEWVPEALRGHPTLGSAGNGRCDRRSAFATGRCAAVISMPGTLNSMLLESGKYSPIPQQRTDPATGLNTTWQVSSPPGSYWGRRMAFPGSSRVLVRTTGALANCTAVLCPKATAHPTEPDVLVNQVTFFAEGGESYALRGSSADKKKAALFAFFGWLSTLPTPYLPLSGAYKLSQVSAEKEAELVGFGFDPVAAHDLQLIQARNFRDEQTQGGNAAQDLLMLGFSDYMGAFQVRMRHRIESTHRMPIVRRASLGRADIYIYIYIFMYLYIYMYIYIYIHTYIRLTRQGKTNEVSRLRSWRLYEFICRRGALPPPLLQVCIK